MTNEERYEVALRHIKRHQEMVSGTMHKWSATWWIAHEALKAASAENKNEAKNQRGEN